MAGFQNVGLDLIYGIPGQDLDAWQKTLNQAFLFSPEHLSCYQLTLEEKTPLDDDIEKASFDFPKRIYSTISFMKTSEWLEGAGYLHYEVSNFARSLTSYLTAQSKILESYFLSGPWTCSPFLPERGAMVESRYSPPVPR